ncbi:MAG: hypothetical protein LBL37_05820, partial [Gracilibacteraceae bacterium]|nr:hypothetical protein [Gracilibacteraceae bacterium]
AGILNRFFVYFADLAKRPFMAEYRRRSNILGQSVLCREGDLSYAARALAIDEDGGLVVGLEDGSRKVLVSGETRIRLAG